jgi:signal transduction histidine kinase
MQAMLDQLRAAPLENAGLIEAIKNQCEALGFRTGAHVEFKLGSLPPTETLPPGAHEAILRVAQEALANVGRHARASHVIVSLGAENGTVALGIRDDGAGFDTNQGRRGQGVTNMHARAEEFGGSFELVSRPGNGTSISFSIPYPEIGTPREYRRKALAWGASLVVSILVLSWNMSIGMATFSAIAAVGVVRYAVAYRRAQMRTEAAQ